MKSFSYLTKEEVCREENSGFCCDNAEFAGMLLFGCGITSSEIKLVTENRDVLGRFAALCRKLGIAAEELCADDKSTRYTAVISDKARISAILNDFGLTDPATGLVRHRISPNVAERDCCRRAFTKGAFMAGGTIIDPSKNYNLELVTPYLGLSRDFEALLKNADFEFKTVVRKSRYVLYIKNSEAIQDFLTYIGAYKAQMALINIKIEKELRNDLNRFANSETANLEKAISASVNQTRAIAALAKRGGLEDLPDELQTLAKLRLEHRSMSMAELGRLMTPPLGKSGVNRRFRKIIELADRLCEETENTKE